jgi:divalent metal cation (Fe/Co/Zn/Cd) transporter
MDARGSGVFEGGLASRCTGGPGDVVACQRKMCVIDQTDSRARRTDAVEIITCGYLSGAVVLGLIVRLVKRGWRWVDSAISLVIVVLLVKGP